LLDAAIQLYGRGVGIDWRRVNGSDLGHPVGLPSYPFERRTAARSRVNDHPFLKQQQTSSDRVTHYETHVLPDNPPWVKDHAIYGWVALPAVSYIEMAMAGAMLSGEACVLEEVVFERPCI